MIVPVHNCITPQHFTKLLLYLNIIWTIIVFELTHSISIVDFDSGDSIFIFEVNRPPGPIVRVSPVRVSAHTGRFTVFLYPVHCLVWRAIIVHARILVCWLPKGNIGTCNRVALSLPDCIYYWNRLFRRVFISLNALQIIVISGMYVYIHSIRIIFWQFH